VKKLVQEQRILLIELEGLFYIIIYIFDIYKNFYIKYIYYTLSYHLDVNIDSIVSAFLSLFLLITGKSPKFKVFGGTFTENQALQNIQVSNICFKHIYCNNV